MEILHVTFECYPVAKVGGLADVAGALPKFQQELGHFAKVVMPMHRTKFLYANQWEVVHKGAFKSGPDAYEFTIIKEKDNILGFDLYCVDINGFLDREKVYGYEDDPFRFLYFQVAVLDWVNSWNHSPDVIHVHDHHASLIPFMLKQCYQYKKLSEIKTVLTIHNAEYQGWMSWQMGSYIPAWDTWNWGLLDWNKTINSLAAGVKCADRINTVSPGYMEELKIAGSPLSALFNAEASKCSGILNGIDYSVWDPKTDTLINSNYNEKNLKEGKEQNKKRLCKDFNFDISLPLFVFIGRLVKEKGADLLAPAISKAMNIPNAKFSFLILGSGEKEIEEQLTSLQDRWVGFYHSQIEYNEKLSHLMYAGADFLIMPSRVEPCGLNQMYAMRYGTTPVVRKTGGLKDSVIDYEDPGGYGITFLQATVDDIVSAINRALILYKNKSKLQEARKTSMALDLSWQESAQRYLELYLK